MKKRTGNVFLIIIGILGIIFTTATYFMKSTVEEKTQTERSQRGIQVQCLAEAALERTMNIVARDLNDPRKMASPETLAGKLRRALPRISGGNVLDGMGTSLGKDDPLDLSDISAPIPPLTQETLQTPGRDGKPWNELTEMVEFMVGKDNGSSYNVKVSLSIDKAMRVAPGPSVGSERYKVPGVDIPYSFHSGVKEFLEGKGYTAFVLAFPPGARWLSVSIGYGPISVDLVDVLAFIPGIKEVVKYAEFDVLLSALLPSYYPVRIPLAEGSDIFPPLSTKNGGVTVPALDDRNTCEKNGFLKIESQATITYPDKKSVTKTVFATKEFKCTDVEPVAPMYSFFVSNLRDDRLILADVGGNLFVNNFSGFKRLLGNPKDKGDKLEYPGLIRINGTNPMESAVGLFGNMGGSFDFGKLARGCELALIFDVALSVPKIEGGFKFDAKAKKADTPGTTQMPDENKGTSVGGGVQGEAAYKDNPNKDSNPTSKAGGTGRKVESGTLDAVKNALSGALDKVNIVPKMKGITVYEAPLHLLPPPLDFLDPFAKWDWPYSDGPISFMGVGLPIPLPAYSSTVTHFFGDSALYPTMTKEIEGFVMKKYHQWHFGIIGFPMGPIPLGKQIPVPLPPPFSLFPPIPIPLVHTHEVSNKYEYNLWTLKPTKDKNGDPELQVKVFDPSVQENSPPNLYSVEQYAKKATYYYSTAADFWADAPNRMIQVNGKSCYKLNGLTYIADNLSLPIEASGTFYVAGVGGIVIGGNLQLGGSIEDPYDDDEERKPETPCTVFSLIVRKGGIIFDSSYGRSPARIEGSVYTDKGIAIVSGKTINIFGNWVTNGFNKSTLMGEVNVTYVAYKTRSSLNSPHPTTGKFDPERYHLTLAPGWESWKVDYQ